MSFIEKLHKYSSIASPILLIMISLNAVMNDILMKTFIIETGFNPFAVNGFRIFFSFLIALTWGSLHEGRKVFRGIFQWHHMVRNIVTIMAIACVIKGLSECAITQVDIVTYLIPAFISIIATVVFKEKFNVINFFLVLICISTFIYRVGLTKSYPLILSGLLFAFAEVWIKHKMKKESLPKMLISLGLTGSVLLSYMFVPKLFLLNLKQLFLAIGMGIGDLSILVIITIRSRLSSSAEFLPLRYSSVLFAVLADKIFFSGRGIDYVIMVTIISCSLISILLERFNKKQIN